MHKIEFVLTLLIICVLCVSITLAISTLLALSTNNGSPKQIYPDSITILRQGGNPVTVRVIDPTYGGIYRGELIELGNGKHILYFDNGKFVKLGGDIHFSVKEE